VQIDVNLSCEVLATGKCIKRSKSVQALVARTKPVRELNSHGTRYSDAEVS